MKQSYCKTVFLKEAKWLYFYKLTRGILVATAGVWRHQIHQLGCLLGGVHLLNISSTPGRKEKLRTFLLTFCFQHKSHWRRQQINPDLTWLLAVEIRIYYKKWETDYTSKHIWPQTGLQVIQKEARNMALFTARHLGSHTAAGWEAAE